MNSPYNGPIDLPETVAFEMGTFINSRGLKLATYTFNRSDIQAKKGIVFLAHGYASHAMFDYLLPSSPGSSHDCFTGSVIEGLVNAGFVVKSLDHTSHGRSEGPHGLRCYFEAFNDLVNEAQCFISETVALISTPLPIFLFGLSMGGATVIRMALSSPATYRGIVLYAPMLSLRTVKQQQILGPIRNVHLEPIAGFLSFVAPTLPIAKPALNTHNPDAQREMDEDVLTYSGDCRARVAFEFMTVTNEFMDGGLRALSTPFITFHGTRDTFTDPFGSETLISEAASTDKTYLKVGVGSDVDVDMWHALAAEPGREVVFARALSWLIERSTRDT